MQVVLHPGEKLTIRFSDDDNEENGEINIDGSLVVSFTKESITVSTEWPDTKGRTGILYEEKFDFFKSKKQE